MKEQQPYIAVTGATEISDIKKVSHAINEYFPPESSHFGIMGFLVSDKSLAKVNPIVNEKFLNSANLRRTLEATEPGAVNVLHYNTHERENLSGQISAIFGDTGIYDEELSQAIQLNIFWPDVNEVKKVKDKFPEMKIILQLGRRILENEDRFEIVERLKKYAADINYVLIDPSGGKGVSLNVKDFAPLYRLIRYEFPNLGIALAGGISDKNVTEILEEITRSLATDEFSIDAENRLRYPLKHMPAGNKSRYFFDEVNEGNTKTKLFKHSSSGEAEFFPNMITLEKQHQPEISKFSIGKAISYLEQASTFFKS